MNRIKDYLEKDMITELTERQEIVMQIYIARNKQNTHKMLPIPGYKV